MDDKQRTMRYTVQEDYLDAISDIISANTGVRVSPASFEQDVMRATDMVASIDSKYWAVRLRRSAAATWSKSSPNEFTVRAMNKFGGQTELDKILGGWCDRMLYAFKGDYPGEIAKYRIIDMDVFRREYRRSYPGGVKVIANRDRHTKKPDGTGFSVFDVSLFPDAITVRSFGLPLYDQKQRDLF
jgi:hypothetical protein